MEGLAPITALLAPRVEPGSVLIVGVTGSVASGKSTLCAALKTIHRSVYYVEAISTDGFLFPNAALAARGLGDRKGFPESYDVEALSSALKAVRLGPTVFPGYSHLTYDVEPALSRTLDRPDVLLVEGLGLSPRADGCPAVEGLDLLIYLDADEADLEAWFVQRFFGFWRAAENDPASFYAQFSHLSEQQVDAFARAVWTRINLPNLREHILPSKAAADIVVRKTGDHRMTVIRPQL